MNNTWIGIMLAVVVLGGFLYAKEMKKTPDGFTIESDVVHTYYVNKIIWGDNYTDHTNTTPVHNTEVIAFGDGWEYSTTTDDNGDFKVEVKPGVPFYIKASDGNDWSVSVEQPPVAIGTTFDDRTDK